MVDGNVGTWSDEWGKQVVAPEIAIGTRPVLRFDLRRKATGEDQRTRLPVAVEDITCDSYCLAIDNDYDRDTAPKMLAYTSAAPVVQDGCVFLDIQVPKNAFPGLLDAVKTKEKIKLKAELIGLDAGGDLTEASFVVQFEIVIRNRVYLGGEIPPEVIGNSDYLTRVEILALISQLERPEKGDKGDPGAAGRGITSIVKTASEGLVDTYTVTYSDKSTQLISISNGRAGDAGRGIRSIMKTATEGLVDTYTITFSDNETALFNVTNGKDGEGLKPDATGAELSERFIYGGKPAGFAFACTVTDKVNQYSQLYYYLKRSDEVNDWYEPLVITYFGRNAIDGENIALIPPLEFTKPPAGAEYLTFDMSKHPSATIGHVCIDIAEGEYHLPYDSATGVRRIIKNNGKYYVYFGAYCPGFETGRVYFTQGASGLTQYQWYIQGGGTLSFEEWANALKNLVPEAPVNDRFYARCNKRWVDITDALAGLGLPDPPDPPGDDEVMYYGYVPYSVAGNITKVSQVTKAMLTHADSVITTAAPGVLNKKSIGTVPEGAWVVVLLPAIAGLTACKITDLTGKSAFYENNGQNGSGANGKAVTFNGTAYELYGEFKVNTAELFICIEYK